MNRKERTHRTIMIIAGLCITAFAGLLLRMVMTPISIETSEPKIKLLADANPVLIPIPPDIGLVIMNNLFVPSREGTDHNSFPELIVKGVIIYGDKKKVILATERDLKTDLLVEMGEEYLLPRMAKNTQDPLFQVYQFFNNWKITEITPDYMKVMHKRTEKTETYTVNYQPSEHKRGGTRSNRRPNNRKAAKKPAKK